MKIFYHSRFLDDILYMAFILFATNDLVLPKIGMDNTYQGLGGRILSFMMVGLYVVDRIMCSRKMRDVQFKLRQRKRQRRLKKERYLKEKAEMKRKLEEVDSSLSMEQYRLLLKDAGIQYEKHRQTSAITSYNDGRQTVEKHHINYEDA